MEYTNISKREIINLISQKCKQLLENGVPVKEHELTEMCSVLQLDTGEKEEGSKRKCVQVKEESEGEDWKNNIRKN